MEHPTIDDQIECVKREIKQRLHVYPRLIENGKMKKEFADRQVLLMRSVLKTLEGLRVPTNELF